MTHTQRKMPCGERETQGEDSCVKMEAKIGMMLPQAKECCGFQHLSEARRDPQQEVLEGVWPGQYIAFGLLASRAITQ